LKENGLTSVLDLMAKAGLSETLAGPGMTSPLQIQIFFFKLTFHSYFDLIRAHHLGADQRSHRRF
jgi:hypothetical protein